MFVAALTAAALSPISAPALAGTAAYGGWLWWRRRRDIRLIAYAEGQWRVILADEEVPVQLRGFSLWPWLITLDFAIPGDRRRVALALWPDSCARDEWRRLRVLLNQTPPPKLSGVNTVSTASGRVSG